MVNEILKYGNFKTRKNNSPVVNELCSESHNESQLKVDVRAFGNDEENITIIPRNFKFPFIGDKLI